jgi:3-oxoacyl-[acyl-carrier protein] reductase
MEQVEKKIALVTGASRGIGRAIATELAKCGYHVIINYRSNQQEAQKTLDSIVSQGQSAELFSFDVANHPETAKAISDIIENHKRIDVLVNNAGIHDDMLMVWMQKENWQKVIDTNLNGFFHVTSAIAKQMLLQRSGRIINITSTSGQIGMAGQVNYSASKAGIIGATMALAKEVAKRGVTVNAIAPGFIETEMLDELDIKQITSTIPMARCGKACEVAALAAFLCQPEAGYITGQVIGINGGIC